MQHPNEDLGGAGWIVIVVAAFIIGYVLAKLKLLTKSNAGKFAAGASAVVAATAAILMDTPEPADWRSIAGRLAVFAIVWVVFGIVFTVGVSWGIEKASKK